MPVTTAEMFLHDKWRTLPLLPMIDNNKRMHQPNSLTWTTNGLLLAGGCWVDYVSTYSGCTAKVWKLVGDSNKQYIWNIMPYKLGESWHIFNCNKYLLVQLDLGIKIEPLLLSCPTAATATQS